MKTFPEYTVIRPWQKGRITVRIKGEEYIIVARRIKKKYQLFSTLRYFARQKGKDISKGFVYFNSLIKHLDERSESNVDYETFVHAANCFFWHRTNRTQNNEIFVDLAKQIQMYTEKVIIESKV